MILLLLNKRHLHKTDAAGKFCVCFFSNIVLLIALTESELTGAHMFTRHQSDFTDLDIRGTYTNQVSVTMHCSGTFFLTQSRYTTVFNLLL